jgi:predicted MFS family arabinose efflux permease
MHQHPPRRRPRRKTSAGDQRAAPEDSAAAGSSPDPAQQRHSRLTGRAAVFALFASFGTILATWAVHLPALQHATGISTALLGTVLLLVGAGALTGMQICGPLIDRYGAETVAAAGSCAMALAVMVPLTATTALHAAIGAFVFGVATGSADVSMNAVAVSVERDYGRPIMASFHAVFSVGNVAGSLLGALGFALGVGVVAAAATICAICLIVIAGASAALLCRRRRTATPAEAPCTPPSPGRQSRPRGSRRVLILGAMAFLLFMCEGSATDWSSLHAQQHLGASQSLGALAFGCFVGAMTLGRFSVDRIAARVGPVRVVRWGSAAAIAGLALVVASPVLPLTLLGWTVFGLGLAGGVPQVITATGSVDEESGRALSRVVGLGYAGMLAGPAIIGWLAELRSLNAALIVPLCGVAICAVAARTVASAPDPEQA